jgi:hypothetical protein
MKDHPGVAILLRGLGQGDVYLTEKAGYDESNRSPLPARSASGGGSTDNPT